MMKSYLIVLGAKAPLREAVQKFLTDLPGVTYWYACLRNCVFCTSSLSAHDIAKAMENNFGNKYRFLVCEISENIQGRLPNKAWHLFRNPDDPRLDEAE